MNVRLIAFALLSSAFLFSGCTKDASRSVIGSYTYKISGTLTLVDDAAVSPVEEDYVVVEIPTEQGQMHIMDEGSVAGGIIITFNDILGNADVAYGTLNGGNLSLNPGNKKYFRFSNGLLPEYSGTLDYTGQGTKRDDMLVVGIVYGGKLSQCGKSMTVVESNVNCVARHN